MFVFDILLMVGLTIILSQFFGIQHLIWGVVVYSFSTYMLKDVLYDRLDLVMIFLTFFSFYFIFFKKKMISAIFLCLAIAYKLMPLILIPLWSLSYLYYSSVQINYKIILRTFIKDSFLFSFFLIVVIFFYYNQYGEKIFDFLGYHSNRGIQIESLYSNIVILLNNFNFKYYLDTTYGSQNVISGITNLFKILSPILIICGEIIILFYFIKFVLKNKMEENKKKITRIINYAIITILNLLVFSKVLSTQYLIFLIPFISIVILNHNRKVGYYWTLSVIFTYLIFPIFYFSDIAVSNVHGFGDASFFGSLILSIRNASLLLLFFQLIKTNFFIEKTGTIENI